MTAAGESGLPAIGDVLHGRYRIVSFLGAGAMASVFRGVDLQLGRDVAIKVFTTRADALGDRERRQKEARLLATVTHPSLIMLYDGSFTATSVDYLVLEYVGGGALRTVMDAGPLPSDAVAALAADIGDALRVVHEAGIVHRDVTPGNILLRSAALGGGVGMRAVLSDFGIAHSQDAARLTSPGVAVGTAAYMSPEQARGAEPHPASDVYSLGLVLLEALTGTRAFAQMAPIESIIARLSAPPTIPRELEYGWRTLLTAMTAVDPAERPTDEEVVGRAREMAGGTAAREALATAAALESTQPLPVTPGADAAVVAAAAALAAVGHAASSSPDPSDPTGATTALPHVAPRRADLRRGGAATPRRRRPLVGALAAGALVVALLAAGWAAFPAPGATEPPETGPTPSASLPPEEATPVEQPAEVVVVDAPAPEAPADPAPAVEPETDVEPETAAPENGAPGAGNSNGNGNGPGSNSGSGPGQNSGNGNGNGR